MADIEKARRILQDAQTMWEGKFGHIKEALAALKDEEPEEVCRLKDCPIGLFLSAQGELCLKTEYSDNSSKIDAYIVSSGEFFWGGAQRAPEQRMVRVRPLKLSNQQIIRLPALERAAKKVCAAHEMIYESAPQGQVAEADHRLAVAIDDLRSILNQEDK